MDQTISRTAVAPSPPPVMIGGAIPLIDVSGFLAGTPGAAEKAAAQLAWAFENVGFYYLAGHGVPQSLIDAQYEQAARFHAQAMEEKLKVKVNEHTIGYMPIADKAPPNAAAQGKKPSQNEAYFLRRERTADDPDVIANRRFHTMNQWPADLPGFREQTLKYMATLEALCRKLVKLYALALDLPAEHFDGYFRKPHMILRQSRYPQIDAGDNTIASLVPHTDSGFMTLLPPNKVQGLSINLPNGEWMDAPYVESASCRRRIACATSLAPCAMPSPSSAIPTTTRSSSACRPASRRSGRPSIRRSSSAIMRCGSRPSATSTCRKYKRRPKPTSRPVSARRRAGRASYPRHDDCTRQPGAQHRGRRHRQHAGMVRFRHLRLLRRPDRPHVLSCQG
jgi:isopenicillin N synthase-like dioxygenase